MQHPYDYINEHNFDAIKMAFDIGLNTGKTPIEISQLITKATGIDQTVALAIVQLEILPTLQELEKKKVQGYEGLNDNI